ncbi:hypothetical protein, partial [Xanthomonas perforans]|uniref:hypothetical protein n=1 Tax=Xanthomonas perforans TaxID=442694 RepID=UPI001F419291
AARQQRSWRHGSRQDEWPAMIPPPSPQPPCPAPAAAGGTFAQARLEKSAEGRIPQAIGRVAAWTTTEHDPNDR